MTPIEITKNGITIKSFNEISQELRNDWISTFGGEAIDLSSSSPDGHQIDLEARQIHSIAELIQSVIAKLTFEGASGIWLDIFLSYRGIKRLGSAYSYVNLKIFGAEGTNINAGTIVFNLFGDKFAIDSNVTILSSGFVNVRATSLYVGIIDVSSGTWSFENTISGVDSVIVENNGVTGRDVETDGEFKLRSTKTFVDGLATIPTMKSYIENNVSGIISVSISENEASFTDSNGRPAHSFETYVLGGSDDDIAKAIFACKPAGIKAYGTHVPGDGYTVYDSSGNPHFVNWAILSKCYVWIKVSITKYYEENLPENYSDVIKQNIIEWAKDEYSFGKDIIPNRLNVPIYRCNGIDTVSISVAVVYNSETIPSPESYVNQRIAISESFAAIATAERIEVALND